MSEIIVRENESLDNALKRFKRDCAKAGIQQDLRKKEYYQSPSVKRRKKSEARTRKSVIINRRMKNESTWCSRFFCSFLIYGVISRGNPAILWDTE